MPKKHNITIDGVTQTMAQWARQSGTMYDTIRTRLRNGWNAKEAVFKPTQGRKNLMSSTGRGGAQRADYDKYYTPDWLVDEGIKIVDKLLEYSVVLFDETNMLEPCCGSGAIVKKMQQA